MDGRRAYKIKSIFINSIRLNKVVIDPHYELKHSEFINDELILDLVKQLDGRQESPVEVDGAYSYYATLIEFEGMQYRLVWLLEDKAIYVGVVNAYRDRRKK